MVAGPRNQFEIHGPEARIPALFLWGEEHPGLGLQNPKTQVPKGGSWGYSILVCHSISRLIRPSKLESLSYKLDIYTIASFLSRLRYWMRSMEDPNEKSIR
jgi:hypothetical protein